MTPYFAEKLQLALEPLYTGQKKRFERLKHVCGQTIAAYAAQLENLSSTPLPDLARHVESSRARASLGGPGRDSA